MCLRVARELGDVERQSEFGLELLGQLRGLVPFDLASWNLVGAGGSEVELGAVDPADSVDDTSAEVLSLWLHQNPLVAHAHLNRVHKFSDYISLRQLHGLELYDTVYRHRGVEHQIAFQLPAPPRKIIGIAISRTRRDFSERERSLLVLIRPLVTQIYERLAMLDRLGARLAALEQAADSGRGFAPAELGLTRRESEIMELVADGSSNAQIGYQLGVSQRTVAKHLEHAFQKLGVGSRTAAVARLRATD
jgi:DNA-binding CsgD family transcriptional regulator